MATPKLDIGGLPIDTLVGLVREAQRQRLCAEGGLLWADYIKVRRKCFASSHSLPAVLGVALGLLHGHAWRFACCMQ